MIFELSALLLGFAGSFHCVAMCGPIAFALSSGSEKGLNFWLGRSLYNFGRIFTYAFLGMIAGWIGHSFLFAGFQKSLSIGIGVFMILSVLILYRFPGNVFMNSLAVKLNRFIKSVFRTVIQSRSKLSLFIAGLANGVLPCGFVYLALAGATTTLHPGNGALYMAFFGFGTFPAMMVVTVFGKIAGIKMRNYFLKATPFIVILLGVLLIFRGINMKDDSCCHSNVTLEKHATATKD